MKHVVTRTVLPCSGRRTFTSTSNKSSLSNLLGRPLVWYSKKLETHPITTKCFSSGIIAGSGDVTCQYITLDKTVANSFVEKWDATRTGRLSFLGFALVAPCVHFWFGLLHRRVPGSGLLVSLRRTAVDQTVFGPTFMPLWVTCNMTLEGSDRQHIVRTLRKDYVDMVVSGWSLWIPSQIVNFAFVPFKFQVLFSNATGFVWSIYLSYKAGNASSSR